MIIGKIIKEIRKYGWTIWERVIMFQLPSGLRRTFLNTRECKIQERKQRVIGFLWLQIMERHRKTEVMNTLFCLRRMKPYLNLFQKKQINLQRSPLIRYYSKTGMHILQSPFPNRSFLMCCLKLLKRHCRVVYYNVWILPVWL